MIRVFSTIFTFAIEKRSLQTSIELHNKTSKKIKSHAAKKTGVI